jgi:hypothetical protein
MLAQSCFSIARLPCGTQKRRHARRRLARHVDGNSLYAWLDAAATREELDRRTGQLIVVARTHETPFLDVVVQDARARQTLLGVERVEHENPAGAGDTRVIEQVEL